MAEESVVTRYIPQYICDKITKQYYARIPHEVDFEHIIHNQDFIKMPTKHVSLFGDHGWHHVMNVAEQMPSILNSIKGIYIPLRNQKRFDFMERYGVVLGFIHDIGMSDVTAFGRQMHGEFVAQEVFRPRFNAIFDAMWKENVGNIPWMLLYMYHQKWLSEPPELVFREMLSLAVCHRKQLVPVSILNDANKLQHQMQYFVRHTLQYQYQVKECEKKKISTNNLKPELDQQITRSLKQHYKDFEKQSFAWLLSKNKNIQALVTDIIDTIRAIRCSDAFRQRGTDLKTSAQYQVFVNQFTADAIYALSDKEGRMYFLELGDPISSGEANLASVGFTKEGDIRFEFHRGYFHSPEAEAKGVGYLTSLVAQLDYDVSDTFTRGGTCDHFKPLKRPQLLLESTDDEPYFTQKLLASLIALKADFKNTATVVPSLKFIPHGECQHYLDGLIINWSDAQKKAFLKRIAAGGHKVSHIDINRAFSHARVITVEAGEVLFEAKTFSGFVYFPFSRGLEGYPTGSYSPFKVAPFTPLGNTGVIRGDIRNAQIIARQRVKLLVIPKQDYLQYWYATYTKDEFVQLILNGTIR
jgi:hypothetical protein